MTDSTELTRSRIAFVAAGILDRSVEWQEGCASIAKLRVRLGEAEWSDADLLVFVALDSELDVMPTAGARRLWEEGALAEADDRKARYFRQVSPPLERACRRLVARWGNGPG